MRPTAPKDRSIPAPAAVFRRVHARGSGSNAAIPMRCGSMPPRPAKIAGPLSWQEQGRGSVAVDPQLLGDAVLARKDVATSYHLAVTVDDALQGVTLVTRGQDLFHATHLHRLLQALLGLQSRPITTIPY